MTVRERAERFLGDRRLAPVLFVVAGVLVAPSILVGFSSDDHFVRMVVKGFPGMPELSEQDGFHGVPLDLFAFATGDVANNEAMMARGLLPWWTYPAMRQRVMHPLTGVTHWFDYTLFKDSPTPAHLHSIFLFALIAFPATMFYRRLTGVAWVGGLAAWLYMIDDARGMPVGWISNRYIFHAIFLSFLALYGHHRWQSEGWKIGAVLGPVCVALGFGCGEAMAAIVAYLVAYELFLAKGSWLMRGMALVPYGCVVIGWRLAYTGFGFGTFGSGIYVDMGRQPTAYLEKMVSHLPVLLLGMWGKPNATWYTFMPSNVQWGLWTGAILYLGVLVWAGWRTLRSDAIARFAFVGGVVATLPLCATITDDRLLMFPSIGGALFVARVLEQGMAPRLFAYVLIGIHLVLAPMLLPVESMRQGLITRIVDRANEGIEEQDTSSSDTIVVINPPSDWLPTLFPIAQSAWERTVPQYFVAMTAGGGDVHVTREDENTFLVTQEDGMFPYPFGQLHRAIDLAPWTAGDVVDISGVHVEILSVTDDARPIEVRFQFDAADEQLKLYSWDGFTYVPASMAVGEARVFAATGLAGPFAKPDNLE